MEEISPRSILPEYLYSPPTVQELMELCEKATDPHVKVTNEEFRFMLLKLATFFQTKPEGISLFVSLCVADFLVSQLVSMACRVLPMKRCYRHEKDASLSLLLAAYLQNYTIQDERILRVIDEMALHSIILLNDPVLHRCFMKLIDTLLQRTPSHYSFWYDWIFTLYAVHSYSASAALAAKIPYNDEVAAHCDALLASCLHAHVSGDIDEDKVHSALYTLTGVIFVHSTLMHSCFFSIQTKEMSLHKKYIPHKPSGTTSLRTSILR